MFFSLLFRKVYESFLQMLFLSSYLLLAYLIKLLSILFAIVVAIVRHICDVLHFVYIYLYVFVIFGKGLAPNDQKNICLTRTKYVDIVCNM